MVCSANIIIYCFWYTNYTYLITIIFTVLFYQATDLHSTMSPYKKKITYIVSVYSMGIRANSSFFKIYRHEPRIEEGVQHNFLTIFGFTFPKSIILSYISPMMPSFFLSTDFIFLDFTPASIMPKRLELITEVVPPNCPAIAFFFAVKLISYSFLKELLIMKNCMIITSISFQYF